MARNSLKQVGGTALVLVVVSLGAKLLAFVRDGLIAAHFGASRDADVFNLVFPVWVQLSLFLMIGVSNVLVPRYIKEQRERGDAGVATLLGGLLLVVAVVMVPVTAAAGVWAEPLARLIGQEFDAESLALSATMLRWTLPVPLIAGVCGVYMAVSRARGHFRLPELAMLAINGGMVVGLLASAKSLGILSTAVGLTGGFIIMGAVLVAYPIRERIPLKLEPKRMAEGAGLLALSSSTTMVGHNGGYVMTLVNRVFFAVLPGGQLTCYSLAERVMQLPMAITMPVMMTTLLPTMAERYQEDDPEAVSQISQTAARVAFAVLAPMLLFMALTHQPIIQLLFGRGAFDNEAARLTGVLLVCLLPSAAARITQNVFATAFYGKGDLLSPNLAGTVGVVVCLALFPIVLKPGGAVALALVKALADLSGMYWLMRRAKKRLGLRLYGMPAFFGRLTLGTLPPLVAAWLVVRATGVYDPDASDLRLLLGLGVGCAVYGAVYLGTARLVALEEVRKVERLALDRIRPLLRRGSK